MLHCDRIFVEGSFDKTLLEKLISYNVEIEASGGKSNIINKFKTIKSISSPLQKGNICFIVDGDEEGYDSIFNSLKNEFDDLVKDPPYIKKCVEDLCYVLVVMGEEKDNYKGCIESILLKELSKKIDIDIERIVNSVIEYETRRRKMNLKLCDKDKIRFYLSIFLLSDDPTTLYLTKNFTDELLKILDKNKIKEIYRKFIEIK
ncbi:MAG: DUF3226 domain-containing protein [Sulfolobaceae archaeon]